VCNEYPLLSFMSVTESEINKRRNVLPLLSYDCVECYGRGVSPGVEGPKFLGIVMSKLSVLQG